MCTIIITATTTAAAAAADANAVAATTFTFSFSQTRSYFRPGRQKNLWGWMQDILLQAGCHSCHQTTSISTQKAPKVAV